MISYNARNSNIIPNCSVIETTMKFICKLVRPLESKPFLKSKENCSFNFEWFTSEACPDQHTEIEKHLSKDPLIFSIDNSTSIDLNTIFESQTISGNYTDKKEQYYFAITKNMTDYLLKDQQRNHYTKELHICDNAFVCQLKKDRSFIRAIAKLENSTLKNDGQSFHLFLTSNSKCGRSDQNTSAIFNFYCEGDAHNIKFKDENNVCHYIFDLYHPKVCEFEKLFAERKSKKVNTTGAQPVENKPNEALKPADAIVSNDKKNETNKVVEPESKPTTTIAPEQKIPQKTLASADRSQANSNQSGDSNSNTTLFGFLILVIVSVVGIVLAVFSLINDDKRAWLQRRVRSVVQPQNAAAFHYSQVHNSSDSSRLVPLDSVNDD